jgi:dynein heavy chain 2
LIFFEQINRGTIQLVEFVLQLITSKGFYNDSLQWIYIEKIQFVFAMSAAEKPSISIRFPSIGRICAIQSKSPEQLNTIYSQFISKILSKHNIPDSICGQIIKNFTPIELQFKVDGYPHYQFTCQDLARCIVNLQRYVMMDFRVQQFYLKVFKIFERGL